MRSTLAALAALAAAASPAAAQSCGCGGHAEPATVVVPHTRYVPYTRYSAETVLVPRTRYERRVTYVPRTRFVPRIVDVPHTVYLPSTAYPAYVPRRDRGFSDAGPDVYGAGYPAGYRYGASYVPPGAAYGCQLGTVGCDSAVVGPVDY